MHSTLRKRAARAAHGDSTGATPVAAANRGHEPPEQLRAHRPPHDTFCTAIQLAVHILAGALPSNWPPSEEDSAEGAGRGVSASSHAPAPLRPALLLACDSEHPITRISERGVHHHDHDRDLFRSIAFNSPKSYTL